MARGELQGGGTLIRDGGLFGPAVADGNEYYRIVTNGFLHAGPLHLFLNMLVLYILGALLEGAIGTARMVGIYFVSLLGGVVRRPAAGPERGHGRGLRRRVRDHGRDLPDRPPARGGAARFADRPVGGPEPGLHLQRARNQHRRPHRWRSRAGSRRCSTSSPSAAAGRRRSSARPDPGRRGLGRRLSASPSRAFGAALSGSALGSPRMDLLTDQDIETRLDELEGWQRDGT